MSVEQEGNKSYIYTEHTKSLDLDIQSRNLYIQFLGFHNILFLGVCSKELIAICEIEFVFGCTTASHMEQRKSNIGGI